MIALYGATAEVYDHVTRHPGGFEKLMQGFAYLKEAGTGFIVQLIPMKDNYHQWEEMISLAKSLSKHWRCGAPWLYLCAEGSAARNEEIRAQRLSPACVVELDRPNVSYEERNCDDETCGLADPSDDRLFARCIEGRRDFHIDPYGKMSWCGFIKDPALCYDLKKGTFAEAWETFIPPVRTKSGAEMNGEKTAARAKAGKTAAGARFMRTWKPDIIAPPFRIFATLRRKHAGSRKNGKKIIAGTSVLPGSPRVLKATWIWVRPNSRMN